MFSGDGNVHEHEHEHEAQRTPGRRDSDYDWRIRAPRWLLVLIIVSMGGIMPVAGAFVAVQVKNHGESEHLTSQKVTILEQRILLLERLQHESRIEMMESRIDALRFQEYIALRSPRDIEFARDIRERIEILKQRREHLLTGRP